MSGFTSIIEFTTGESNMNLVERDCDEEAEQRYTTILNCGESQEDANYAYFETYWECINSGEGQSEYTVDPTATIQN
jgi:hypothetical protein